MQRTLYQHFVFLEERLLAMRDQVTDPSCTSADIDRITVEMEVVESALARYRAALDLERTIR
jgi:hypothetical protein